MCLYIMHFNIYHVCIYIIYINTHNIYIYICVCIIYKNKNNGDTWAKPNPTFISLLEIYENGIIFIFFMPSTGKHAMVFCI